MSFRPQGGIWKFFASLGMTERMDNLSRPYQDELLKSLTDPEAAAAYLNAAIDEGSEELLLLALRNIGEARTYPKNLSNHKICPA